MAPRQHRKQMIAAQFNVIVKFFIPKGQTVHLLTKQLIQGVFDPARVSPIAKTLRVFFEK